MSYVLMRNTIFTFALVLDFALTFFLLYVFGAALPLAASIAAGSTGLSILIILKKLKQNNGG